jgi:hypothetical protein
MGATAAAVFDSIESAHEYIGLLCEALDEAQGTVAEELTRGSDSGRSRHVDALRLADYKLEGLRQHLVMSRRLLNDLRTIRRYLFEERVMRSSSMAAGTSSQLVALD